jgi:NDP-sugar pyrophosphorylase family protein
VQLIIPMSGIGQRFIDKSYKVPKPLIQISGKPMVQHVVEMYPGIEEVLFIVNKSHFEDAKLELQVRLNEIAPGCSIAVIDSHKFGPAWAIAMARQYVNLEAPVVVNYCDFACLWDFEAFRASLASGVDGVIATYSGFHPHMLRNTQYAYLRLDENGFVTDIQEKLSFTASPMGEPASSGTYGFKSGHVLLDAIDSQINQGHSYNNEFYSSLTYKSMLQNDLKIRSFEIRKFFQWGTPEDFEEFKKQKDFFVFKHGIQRQPKKPDRIEILAAGAGQRFVDVGYLQPKPFLPLGNTFLAFEALNAISPNSKRNGLLLQSAFEVTGQFEEILLNNETRVITVEKLTSGQAASALLVLEQNDKGNCIIATCDSLLFPKPDENFDMFRGKTLGVWVTNPSAFALSHPKQFGWVKSGQDRIVTDTWVKEAPEEIDSAQVITGTFIFGDSREAQMLLRKFLDSPSKVNGEFYLDSVLQFAAESEWKVVALDPEWFVSLGTPSEYEAYIYWESVFNERLDLLKSDDN